MDIYWYVSLLMCRKHPAHAGSIHVSCKSFLQNLLAYAMFRKHASHKSARKFPTKCTHELASYVMHRKHASYKSAGISYKTFSWYKFEHYCLYHERVQELFLHTSANAAQVWTHTVKTWSFLSSAGNIIPALQPPNTDTL